MALSDFINNTAMGAPSRAVLPPQGGGASRVMGNLEQIVGSGSPYIENARRRGLETAAARGGINSSIAAGASERSALEAAMPLLQAAEATDQAATNVNYDNWLSQQNFGRALYGQRFNSSLGMLEALQRYALEDPELYTPEVTSGFSNFFERNTQDILSRYFGARS